MKGLTEDEADELRTACDIAVSAEDCLEYDNPDLAWRLKEAGLLSTSDIDDWMIVFDITPRGRMALRIHDAIALGASSTTS